MRSLTPAESFTPLTCSFPLKHINHIAPVTKIPTSTLQQRSSLDDTGFPLNTLRRLPGAMLQSILVKRRVKALEVQGQAAQGDGKSAMPWWILGFS